MANREIATKQLQVLVAVENRQLADDVEKARKAAASRPQFLFEGTGLAGAGGSSGSGLGNLRPSGIDPLRRMMLSLIHI